MGMIEYRIDILLNAAFLLGILCAGGGLIWLVVNAFRRLNAPPKGGAAVDISPTESVGEEAEYTQPRIPIWRPLAVGIIGIALAVVSYWYYDELAIPQAWANYEQAISDHDSGELDRAIERYIEAVYWPLYQYSDSDYYLAHLMRGDAYDRMNDINEAITEFDKAIAIHPEESFPYLSRGGVHYRKGDH